MSLTLNRLTGSNEATKLYHHAGLGISKNDVREYNNKWGKDVSLKHKKMLPPGFVKGKSVHVTNDNQDGKENCMKLINSLGSWHDAACDAALMSL